MKLTDDQIKDTLVEICRENSYIIGALGAIGHVPEDIIGEIGRDWQKRVDEIFKSPTNNNGWIKVDPDSPKTLPPSFDWVLGIFKEPDTQYVIPIPFVCERHIISGVATTKEGYCLRGITDTDNPTDYYKSLEIVEWQNLPEHLSSN